MVATFIKGRLGNQMFQYAFSNAIKIAQVYCSVLIGYHAKMIKVVDRVIYIVTRRPNSLIANWCTKPGELKQRAEVAFRIDKFKYQNGFCRDRWFVHFLLRMPRQDRELFKYYFFKLDEIYPSKLAALQDISKSMPLRFKVIFYLYSFLVWTRIL